MRLAIASDIHGAASWCRGFMEALDAIQPDKVVLLGDVLYHGPRNDVPQDYAPKDVITMMNSIADNIIAVRGNCEAEVDQMVLNFACMADHNILFDPDAQRTLFFTHGHIYGPGLHNSVDCWPQLASGSALVYGHTHKKVHQEVEGHEGIEIFNPGSIGIPKDGSHSFGLYDNGMFSHHILEEPRA